MTDPAILALCVASSAITSAWHVFAVPAIARERARAEARANCSHSWGDPFEVIPPGPGSHSRQRFYKRSCSKCDAQLNVNADGTPYVPVSQRDDK